MHVYRISKEKYISDLSGRGSELNGGRWNYKGLPALYTSQSLSLSLCELLVHLDKQFFPNDLFYAEFEVPDKLISNEFENFDLTKSTADAGSEWLRSKQSLAIRVPSFVVVQEFNVIINPLHAEFKKVKLLKTAPFILDERLWK